VYGIAAEFTQKPGFFTVGRKIPAEFIGGFMTAFTHDERLPRFYLQNRNEKQIKIIVNPHLISLVKTAVGTPSGVVVYFPGFWCYAADKKKHLG
jgi:hypothetical protein